MPMSGVTAAAPVRAESDPTARGSHGAPARQRARRPAVALRRPSELPVLREALGAVRDVVRSPGQPLDSTTLAFAEPRFDRSLADVQIHTDARAAASARGIGARAYTVGRHIAFAPGQFAPGTPHGRRLLLHELTHVAQQASEPVSASNALQLGATDSPLEHEADRAADRLMAHGSTPLRLTTAPVGIRRSCGPAAIGAPAGCAGLDGDIPGEHFLFKVGCDEFRAPPEYTSDEQARLVAFARTLSPGATVHIHGFASLEGDASFNQNLSCARALTAQRVMSSAAPAVTFNRLAHGATAGNREDRRSVMVDVAPAPPQAEQQPQTLQTPQGPTAPAPAPATPLPPTLKFWFQAFIPNTLPGAHIQPTGTYAGRQVFRGPSLPFHYDSCFETDARTFDPTWGASSRMRFMIEFDTTAGTATITNGADLTFEVDCTTGAVKCATTPAPNTSVHVIPPVLPGSRRYDVTFSGFANDPCVFGSPNIAIRGNLIIDLAAREVQYRPTMTLFPAIEMYADMGAGTVTCFTHAPSSGSVSSLFVPGVVPVPGRLTF